MLEVFSVSALCLAAGHFAIPPFRSQLLLVGSAVFLLATVVWYVLKRGFWQSAMLLLVLSHFCYGNGSGGLWNFWALAAIMGTLLWLPRVRALHRDRLLKGDGLTFLFVLVLLISNVLGWVLKNPAPLWILIQGASPLLAYLLVFWKLSRTPVTPARVHLFLALTAVMAVWMLAVGVTQRAGLNSINSPIFGYYDPTIATSRHADEYSRADTSLFDHSELYGEYAALVLILFLPFLMTRAQQSFRAVTFLAVLVSAGNILLSSSRSCVVISFLGLLLTVIAMRHARLLRAESYMRILLSIVAVAVFVAWTGDYFGFNVVTNKFTGTSSQSLTLEGVLTGSSINREVVFQTGFNRLRKESWWVGYGSGLPDYNLAAWTGSTSGLVLGSRGWTQLADLHSQYMQAVILNGWIGTAAYCGLLILPLLRLARSLPRVAAAGETGTLAIGLGVCFAVFLVDQYKIAALRSMNYQMLHWIWLGIAHATTRALLTSPARGVVYVFKTFPGNCAGGDLWR